jgi:hypothetical protein
VNETNAVKQVQMERTHRNEDETRQLKSGDKTKKQFNSNNVNVCEFVTDEKEKKRQIRSVKPYTIIELIIADSK